MRLLYSTFLCDIGQSVTGLELHFKPNKIYYHRIYIFEEKYYCKGKNLFHRPMVT